MMETTSRKEKEKMAKVEAMIKVMLLVSINSTKTKSFLLSNVCVLCIWLPSIHLIVGVGISVLKKTSLCQ